MWLALVALILLILAFVSLHHRRRARQSGQSPRKPPNFNEIANSLRETAFENIKKFMYSPIHYQMREAVDKSPFVRSPKFREILKENLFRVEPEYHAIAVYMLRWLDNGYPGPVPSVCALNRSAGGERQLPA